MNNAQNTKMFIFCVPFKMIMLVFMCVYSCSPFIVFRAHFLLSRLWCFTKSCLPKAKTGGIQFSGVMRDACRKPSDKLESQQGQCFQTHFLLFWWEIADIPYLRLINWLILSTIYVTLRIVFHEKMRCALRIRNGYWGKRHIYDTRFFFGIVSENGLKQKL